MNTTIGKTLQRIIISKFQPQKFRHWRASGIHTHPCFVSRGLRLHFWQPIDARPFATSHHIHTCSYHRGRPQHSQPLHGNDIPFQGCMVRVYDVRCRERGVECSGHLVSACPVEIAGDSIDCCGCPWAARCMSLPPAGDRDQWKAFVAAQQSGLAR